MIKKSFNLCYFQWFSAVMILSLSSTGSKAMDLSPFHTSNKSPFTQIFGLPPAQSAVGPRKGEFSLKLLQDMTNNFVSQSRNNELVSLDGESWQSSLVSRIGVSRNIDLGLQIAHLNHKGGSFDNFIEDWHDLIQIPNRSRDLAGTNKIEYLYVRDGLIRLNFNQRLSGMTDSLVYLTFRDPFGEPNAGRSAALRAGIKFPTGDEDKLTGSGERDYFVDVMMQGNLSDDYPDYSWYAGAGFLHAGVSQWARDFQKQQVFFGHVGLVWHASQKLDLKLQIDGHTPFYDSRLTPLGNNALQIIMGGSLLISDQYVLDISVSEDIAPGTGPDVSFQISLSRQFL